jgi:hypothetical protein
MSYALFINPLPYQKKRENTAPALPDSKGASKSTNRCLLPLEISLSLPPDKNPGFQQRAVLRDNLFRRKPLQMILLFSKKGVDSAGTAG